MSIAIRNTIDLAARTAAATLAVGGGALAAWAFARSGWPTNVPHSEQPAMVALFVVPILSAAACLTGLFRGWPRPVIYGFALLPASVFVLSMG